MTLTPEQFNKIALQEDLEEVKDDVKKIDKKIDRLINSVDGITSEHNKFDQELTVNQAAHDRMQNDVNEVRQHVGMEIKHPVVEPENT